MGEPFPLPQGVPTTVTLHEVRLLQKYANRAGTVLEIGTHYGFSCIAMALAGAHVTSVDPHFEGPANRPDTWEPFLSNCERNGWDLRLENNRVPYGFAFMRPDDSEGPVIQAWRMAIEDWTPPGPIEMFGLTFIDGNHTWPCPMRDAKIAIAHLTAPRLLAFHDVTPAWPGVWRTTEELLADGTMRKLEQVGTLAVYEVGA